MPPSLIREVAEQVNKPFSEKYLQTTGIIAHNLLLYGQDRMAVAFSGGKDSEVVLYLVRQLAPKILVVFNNTGVEYPETVRFVKRLEQEWSLNLLITHPEKTFWQCVEQYGYPDKSKRGKGKRCCYWLKEKPMRLTIRKQKLLGVFTGLTAVESHTRMFNARDKGTCYYDGKNKIQKVHPILWWTEEEVWAYICQNNLPYNRTYDRGAKRIGCAPCTSFLDWESQLQKVNPKLYQLLKLRKDKQYSMVLKES